jgi:hypothetical protein
MVTKTILKIIAAGLESFAGLFVVVIVFLGIVYIGSVAPNLFIGIAACVLYVSVITYICWKIAKKVSCFNKNK